jgi:hypothetical protein
MGGGQAALAQVDPLAPGPGDYTTVTGTAAFERHQTWVPLAHCDDEGEENCVRAKPYWSLVLHSTGIRYELAQMFAEGSAEAPESIELASTVIRPGSQLAITARVQLISRSYGVLTDVKAVNIVMDTRVRPPFYGWSCHSLELPRPIYVDVFLNMGEHRYSMRVLSAGDTPDQPLRTIASFHRVSLDIQGGVIRFSGATRRFVAELSIDKRDGRVRDLDSLLRVNRTILSGRAGLPLETLVRLACNPTR